MAQHISTSTFSNPPAMQLVSTSSADILPATKDELSRMPNEILVEIAKYLLPQQCLFTGPGEEWGSELATHRYHESKQLAAFGNLLLANKRILDVLRPIQYSHVIATVPIDCYSYGFSAVKRSPLLRQPVPQPLLKQYITTAHIEYLTTSESIPFFWLPRISTLSIAGFDAEETMTTEDLQMDVLATVGSSQVKVLYLDRCGSNEKALAQVLSWPKELKEFWYDGIHDKWAEGKPISEALGQCLQNHKKTLQKLVCTRMPGDDDKGYGDVLDLNDFSQLKSLILSSIFLTGRSLTTDVGSQLPPCLEELEIVYDEITSMEFYQDFDSIPEWLFGLLREKELVIPNLERLRITSILCEYNALGGPDDVDEPEYCNRYSKRTGGTWRPPLRLMKAFDAAKLNYSIYFNEEIRYRKIFDTKGFEHFWEDNYRP